MSGEKTRGMAKRARTRVRKFWMDGMMELPSVVRLVDSLLWWRKEGERREIFERSTHKCGKKKQYLLENFHCVTIAKRFTTPVQETHIYIRSKISKLYVVASFTRSV